MSTAANEGVTFEVIQNLIIDNPRSEIEKLNKATPNSLLAG